MRDHTEAALLRSIAEEIEGTTSRLLLADFLEERGESDRADFIRVQCALAAPDLPAERRHLLRQREQDLLQAHRQEWLQAFGLPLEDVRFERGVIASARLSAWEEGKLLDADHAPWLATLTELDLSGLGIGDNDLRAFAKIASFPALRRLLLNDNKITVVGAGALSQARGVPRLETLYLFDNTIGEAGSAALENAAHFRLVDLDVGAHEVGYSMSPGQADMMRRRQVRQEVLPRVTQYFQTYPLLQSAALCVAQYWADEADDAVHGTLVVSELLEPDLGGAKSGWDDEEPEADPNVPNTRIKSEYGEGGSEIDLNGGSWDDNGDAIPLWSAFAPEEGSQEYEKLSDAYAPAVLFYRHGGYEFRPMLRPHLNGVRPEWDS